jgi:asparagine synthase (glutamine-hydrolysing)
MSGIMGIYYLDDSPVERENLVKMVDILAHRGTDGAGIWVEGVVGFGHRMLWTTPESLIERLPLVNRTSDIVITTDCRIDNRQELISVFQFQDCPPEKITDSQLILAAYEKWGEQCPEHLLGDFAFAIWDKREQKLFCARDHFGVKPFYYYSKNEFFTFATEIKALWCVPQVPRLLNRVRVGDYLADIYEDNAITFYENIFRLPPAHSMVINQSGVQIKSYWSLDRDRELLLDSDEEYAAKFREIFAEAVRCRLRSAFPIGSMLSGGLDSSSITCMARKILSENNKQPLHTYSAVFDEVPQSDESPYIKAVLAQGGTVEHYLHADKVSPLTDLEQVLWHLDEPVFAGNLYINWNIYGIAKNQNIRIMLDGFDGDNTVSHGVGYLSELALAGRWLTLCREIQGFAKNFKFSFWQIFWQYVYNYGFNRLRKYKPFNLIHRLWQAGSKRLWRPNVQEPSRNVTLNPAFVEKIGLEQRRQNLPQGRNLPQLNQRHHHYQCLTSAVLPYTLEILDRASAGFGIELRYPFWDKRLVEFCLSIPANQKMSQGWTRAVLRRALAGLVPQEVQWRGGKGNLAPGFDSGLLKFERERLQQMLTKDPNLIEEYINKKVVAEACQKFISQQSNDDDATVTWKALDLSLWLKYTGLNS